DDGEDARISDGVRRFRGLAAHGELLAARAGWGICAEVAADGGGRHRTSHAGGRQRGAGGAERRGGGRDFSAPLRSGERRSRTATGGVVYAWSRCAVATHEGVGPISGARQRRRSERGVLSRDVLGERYRHGRGFRASDRVVPPGGGPRLPAGD